MNEDKKKEFIDVFEAERGYKPCLNEYGDGWSSPFEDGAWWGWCSSRNVLVVELPGLREVIYGRRDSEHDSGFNVAIELCQHTIESVGILVKQH